MRNLLHCCLLALASLFCTYAQAQSPPRIMSVTPADGATGVATNTSTLVFVFDQDMNVQVSPLVSTATYTGNYAIQPGNLLFSGSWGTDKRTLTFKHFGSFPYDTNISWTLNPPGQTLGKPLSSAAGQPLATVSGSFHTAAYVPPPPVPKLVSVSPINNSIGVSPVSPLVLVFDQDMDTNTVMQASTFTVIGYPQRSAARQLQSDQNPDLSADRGGLCLARRSSRDFRPGRQ